jgi:hypothetical protein
VLHRSIVVIFGSCVQWIFARRPQARSPKRMPLSRIVRSCSRASHHPSSSPTCGLWWVAECQDRSDLGHRYEMLNRLELQRGMRVVRDCTISVDVLISRADRVDGVFGLFSLAPTGTATCAPRSLATTTSGTTVGLLGCKLGLACLLF